MGIQMTGIDHSRAGIDIRTIFSFTKRCMTEAYERLGQEPGIRGSVLLSTCNRMELWISTGEEYRTELYELLCELKGADQNQYREYFCFRQEQDAVRHLFRLASGLESRILGEDQIITQVGDALAFAREHYAADHVLETLFRQAVTVGKRVKSHAALSGTDKSAVQTAIGSLKAQGMEFSGKKCMVIGNGVMGKLTAASLKAQGADVTVTVRQYKSGVVEIPRNCSRIDYGRRMEIFGECDYVFSATVSPNLTVTREQVSEYWRKPVVLVDLAVPRDIDPKVTEHPGVRLYDIDCFREEVTSEEQKQAVRLAEEYIGKQMEDFFIWYEGGDVIPKIQLLKEQIAADLEPRLHKELQRMPISEAQKDKLRADIEGAAVRTMNKLLFGLRDGLDRQAFRQCLDCLEDIYGAGLSQK